MLPMVLLCDAALVFCFRCFSFALCHSQSGIPNSSDSSKTIVFIPSTFGSSHTHNGVYDFSLFLQEYKTVQRE